MAPKLWICFHAIQLPISTLVGLLSPFSQIISSMAHSTLHARPSLQRLIHLLLS